MYNNENIAALWVHGCLHKDVCDDEIFPDLGAFAKRFVRTLFTRSDEETLTLVGSNLNDDNTIGIASESWSTILGNPAITSITFCGYSRGAALF